MLTLTFFMLSVLALPLPAAVQEAPMPWVTVTPSSQSTSSDREGRRLLWWHANAYSESDSTKGRDRNNLPLEVRQTLQQHTESWLTHVADRLRTLLGPAWRVDATVDNTHVITSMSIQGPSQADPNEQNNRLSSAVRGLTIEFHQSARAAALPAGAEREEATAKARAAGKEAQAALDELRVETIIVALRSASGEDVVKALKTALPWAAFATIGQTQLLMSGTSRELQAAQELARRMDQATADAALEAAARTRSSPAGRLLAEPFTIDFKGGRVEEYLQLLAGRAGLTSWVIEDPRVQGAHIPAIQLTGVTVDSALMMLDGLMVSTADQAQPVRVPLAVQRINPAEGSETLPIYRIGARFPSQQQRGVVSTVPPAPRTNVFNVFLDPESGDPDDKGARAAWIKQAYETLLAAIETGVGMVGPSDSFKVKLHPPSGILFASGMPEELQLVNDIVQQWQSFH